MLDTKWKNSKQKSTGIAFGIVLTVTVLFLSFFPVYEKRAEAVFENPLTDTLFINMLYRSNYIQYKYLREKADQKTWAYGDLYVDAEYLGADDPESGYQDSLRSVPADAVESSRSLQIQVEEYRDATLPELEDMRRDAASLTRFMDYYAVDPTSGVSISNSSDSVLADIIAGQVPDSSPYIYYVYMEYDNAGNLARFGVNTTGRTDEFLKRVELCGRENYFSQYYADEETAFVGFVNEDAEQRYRYRFQLKRISDMQIIYALTEEQYANFIDSNDYDLPNYVYAMENSYVAAGIPNILQAFLLLSVLSGAAAVWILGRREGRYCYHTFRICRIPAEISLLILCAQISMTQTMTHMLCDYQIGRFLRNLTSHILEPMHLRWVRLLVLGAAFFLYFGIAFTIGSRIPDAMHLKQYLKGNSILYRYWDKIIQYLRKFYQDLIAFDIGTDANRMIGRLVIVNFIVLSIISMLWVWGIFPLILYSLVVYFLLKKYVKDIQDKYHHLLRATNAIAKGDLDIALSEDFGVFESYKKELRQIQTDFKKAVAEEVKSQRMKSELITNVSHDLKTPLTAIITYINLLKEPGITEEQRQEYLNTLDKKSVRLKVLIEDLFEVSKANSNNITLNYAKVDICNLLRQCYLEYEDRLSENALQFKFLLPEEKVILWLDPQKTFRIFENLYTNIIKYALPSTRVYIIVKDLEDAVAIEVKNISRTELQITPEELTERFVRGDGARNTEGSGLGLAIARSFTELQHGTLQISVDGDLFKVTLLFRKWHKAETPQDPDNSAVSPASGQPSDKPSFSTENAQPSVSPYHPSRWRSEKNLRKNQKTSH